MPPSPSLSDVYLYADDLLTACKSALALTTSGCPTQAFVSPGQPAVDCCPDGTLAVWASGITLDATMHVSQPVVEQGHRTMHGRVILVGLSAQISRCIHETEDGSLDDPLTLSAEARTSDEDLWAVWSYVSAALRAGTLWEPCKTIYFDGAVPLLPQGGCAGWTFHLRVEIPGYTVTP